MSRLDSNQSVQATASGPETTTEKEWYREYTGSPPTCLDFPGFLDRSPYLQTNMHHMAPHANHATVTPDLTTSAPKSELEDALHSRTLSLPPEPIMACSREGHEANDFDDTKTCFLEESLLLEYNPILDTSTMYIDVPAEDQGTSNYVLKLPTTNAGVGYRHFQMATPVVVSETSSSGMAQDEHGMQSNQAVSNSELSFLSATLRDEKSLAGDIKDPTSDLVDSAAHDRNGPATVVQSTISLPPNAMATTQSGSPKRTPTKQKGSTKQKAYQDTDIIMGRGGNATYHPGNRRYLAAMKRRLVQYHKSERSEKIRVSQQVVDEVRAWGGRFLKRVGSNEYVEVSNKIARTRVSQALRDGKTSE